MKPTLAEFDLHIWAKPADRNMVALFTVSEGKRAICHDSTIDAALDLIRERMEEAADDTV